MAAKDVVDVARKTIGLKHVQHVAELSFEVDGKARRVFMPVDPDEEPSDGQIWDALDTLELAEALEQTSWYKDVETYATKRFIEAGLADTLSTRLVLELWCGLLERYEREFSRLSAKDQTLRVRRYRPELIRQNPGADDTIEIDYEALDDWLVKLSAEYRQDIPFITDLVEQVVRHIYVWAVQDVLSTPEQNPDYHDVVRQWCREIGREQPSENDFEPGQPCYDALIDLRINRQLKQYGEAELDAAIAGVVGQLAVGFVQVTDITLDQLERRVLGLRISPDPGPEDLVIPTGDGPAAVTEGLNAAADNNWYPDNDGILSYQTKPLPDGLSVKLTVSEDGQHPIAVVKQAEQVLVGINPLAVRLNTLLSNQAEIQDNPWQDSFTLDTDTLIQQVNLGRLGRVAKAKQAKAIVESIAALSRVLVQIDWVDDRREFTRTYSDLWFVTYEAKWEPGQNPEIDLPYRYEVTVRPGGWAARCQSQVNGHRDLLWLGHTPKDVLQQRDGLVVDLQLWYHQTQQTQFTVYDWLCGALGNQSVDAKLADRKAKSKLKKSFTQAIDILKPRLTPGFDLEQADDWVHAAVTKQVRPVKTVSVSEIRQLRNAKGLSLEEIARQLPTRCSRELVRQVELNPGKNPDLAQQLRELLTNKT